MKFYQELDDVMVAAASLAAGFKTVEPYNQQYQNTEKDDPKGYPACYMEALDPINWEQAGMQFLNATMRARAHIVVNTLKTTKDGINEAGQRIFEALNQKQLWIDPTTQLTTEWVLVASSLPKRDNNRF